MESNNKNQEYINLREGFEQNYPHYPPELDATPPERSAPPPVPEFAFAPRHSNNFMLILVLGAVVLPFVVLYALRLVSTLIPGFDAANIPLWVVSVVAIQFVLLGGASVAFMIIKRRHIKDILPLRRLGWRNVIMIVALTLALIPVLSLANLVSQLAFPNVIAEVMEDVIQDGGIWMSLAVFAIVPPIFEEIAFRGVGFVGFKHVKIRTAAIINGLAFGFLHMNMNQFIYAFLGGVIFCYLMYYTKSIWAPILSHFVVNAFGAIMSYFQRQAVSSSYQDTPALDLTAGGEEVLVMLISLGLFALISLAIFIGIYILFKRHNLRRNEAEGIVTDTAAAAREAGLRRPVAFTWAFWASFAIFVMIMLLNYIAVPMVENGL